MNKVAVIGKIFIFAVVSALPDLLLKLVPKIVHHNSIPYPVRTFIEQNYQNAMFPWQALVFGFLFASTVAVMYPTKASLQDVLGFGLVVPLIMLIIVAVLGFLMPVLGAIRLRPDVFVMSVFALFVALAVQAGLRMAITALGFLTIVVGTAAICWAAALGWLPSFLYEYRYAVVGTLIATFAILSEE